MNIERLKGEIIVLPVKRERGFIASIRIKKKLNKISFNEILTATELHTKMGLVSNGKNEYAWARSMELRGLVEAIIVGKKMYYRRKLKEAKKKN